MTPPPSPAAPPPSSTPPPTRWRFPYPPWVSAALVFVAAFGAAHAWMVQRGLNGLLDRAGDPALSLKLRLLIGSLWLLVGGMVLGVIGAIGWRSSLTLTLTPDGLLYKRLLASARLIPDKDVAAVLVRKRAGSGLELVIDTTAGRVRLPLASARRDGAWRPLPAKDPAQHPLVVALTGRYGDRVIVQAR